MSAIDATRLLESRFRAIEEGRGADHTAVEDLSTEVAVLRSEVHQMIDAFKAARTALYTCAGAVIAAAILVVVIGHP